MFRIEDIKTAEMLEQERFDSESQRIRDERDRLIKAEAWRIERYNSEIRQGLVPTDDISLLDDYLQQLRDIPEQAGFPYDVVWPNKV